MYHSHVRLIGRMCLSSYYYNTTALFSHPIRFALVCVSRFEQAEINKCFGSAGGDPCKGPENVYPFSTCVSENTLNGVAPLVALFPADEQKGILGDAAKIAGGVKKCEDDTKESKDATEYNKCAGAGMTFAPLNSAQNLFVRAVGVCVRAARAPRTWGFVL